MRAKIKLSLAAIVFVLLFIGVYGFIIQNSPPQGHDVTILIKQDKHGVWRVHDPSGNKKVIVYRGYWVYWNLIGTDASFQFPDSTIFVKSSEMPNGFTTHKKNLHVLPLQVRDTAATGTYIYSVFCFKDSVYAQGGTPPEFDVH